MAAPFSRHVCLPPLFRNCPNTWAEQSINQIQELSRTSDNLTCLHQCPCLPALRHPRSQIHFRQSALATGRLSAALGARRNSCEEHVAGVGSAHVDEFPRSDFAVSGAVGVFQRVLYASTRQPHFNILFGRTLSQCGNRREQHCAGKLAVQLWVFRRRAETTREGNANCNLLVLQLCELLGAECPRAAGELHYIAHALAEARTSQALACRERATQRRRRLQNSSGKCTVQNGEMHSTFRKIGWRLDEADHA